MIAIYLTVLLQFKDKMHLTMQVTRSEMFQAIPSNAKSSKTHFNHSFNGINRLHSCLEVIVDSIRMMK